MQKAGNLDHVVSADGLVVRLAARPMAKEALHWQLRGVAADGLECAKASSLP